MENKTELRERYPAYRATRVVYRGGDENCFIGTGVYYCVSLFIFAEYIAQSGNDVGVCLFF